MEIHATGQLDNKVTMDDVARMATELEGVYQSSVLPTSLANYGLSNPRSTDAIRQRLPLFFKVKRRVTGPDGLFTP
jgi:hypothetical protein